MEPSAILVRPFEIHVRRPRKFLPGGIGTSLFSVRTVADRLSPGAALLVALLWLVGTFAIATVLISRRDA